MSQSSEPGQQQDARPVIETASATTSSKGNTSGSFAYILAGITIACLLAIGSSMSGCVSYVAGFVAAQHESSPYSLQNYYDDIDHYFENDDSSPIGDEDILNMLDNGSPEQDQTPIDDSGTETLSPTDALSLDLAVYGSTIDAQVSAFAYAGSQEDVASFARTIEHTDGDATTELIGTLRAILREDLTVEGGLSQAAEAADKTAEDLEALEVPGGQADDVTKDLVEARDQAAGRWKAIAAEMRLIASSESISRTDIDDADTAVADATKAAAESLSQALSASAGA